MACALAPRCVPTPPGKSPSAIPVARAQPTAASSAAPRRRAGTAAASGSGGGGGSGNFGDELLDFMYAGRKLRRWYGQEGQVLPRDGREPGRGGEPGEPEPEDDAPREWVAVLDADSSPMAEQAVLQLILNRAKVRALVKDAAAAKAGFGPYIEAVQGDAGDAAALRRALRGAKAAVCCGRLGALLPAAAATRLPHVVLLAAAPPQGFALFASGEQQALSDAGREQALRASGLPYTVVRVGSLAGVPGGTSRLALTAGAPPAGQVSREDAAKALAEAAARDAAAGSLELSLSSEGEGQPPEDWQAAFAALLAGAPSSA